jgi:hypothetical protein
MTQEVDTASGLARRLNVSKQQLITWAMRSERNRFPQPIGRNDGSVAPLIVRRGRPGRLYRVNEVLDWYEWYQGLPKNTRGRPIMTRAS